jgi:hypothetical protein
MDAPNRKMGGMVREGAESGTSATVPEARRRAMCMEVLVELCTCQGSSFPQLPLCWQARSMAGVVARAEAERNLKLCTYRIHSRLRLACLPRECTDSVDLQRILPGNIEAHTLLDGVPPFICAWETVLQLLPRLQSLG